MAWSPPSQSTSTASAQTLGDGYLNGTTSDIPDELLIDEILLRLPVKFLLRFRCVSKQWCSLIDSINFVNKHLRRNIECNPNSGIIFRAYPDSKYFYLEDVDSLVESTIKEIPDPIKTFVLGAENVATCNGLVCLWKDETDVLLWNPAMRKIRKLPAADNIPLPLRLERSSVLGFGYDHLNDDYKVLRTCDSQVSDIMVSVYSLKNNLWTRAEDITSRIRLSRKFGVFANGSVYWIANNDTHFYPGTSDSDFLFAYDLGVERHRELPLPAGVNKTGGVIDMSGMLLMVFDRCLALLDHYAHSCTDIWLMNDNGVENSWTKLLSVEQPGILGDIAWPVAFSKTRNEFLFLVEEDKLVWYDLVRNGVKNITIHGFPILFGSLVYTESLVHLSYDFKSDRKQSKVKKLKQQNNDMSGFLSTGFKLKL